MPGWHPIKRREFIRKLRALGFSGPFRGTRHEFLVLGQRRQTIPTNPDYSVPQLKMLLRQVEAIMGAGCQPKSGTRFEARALPHLAMKGGKTVAANVVVTKYALKIDLADGRSVEAPTSERARVHSYSRPVRDQFRRPHSCSRPNLGIGLFYRYDD